MQMRQLGKTSIELSAIGLGCASLSEGYGKPNEEQSARTLAAAFEAGVTFFDTADLYGNGHNELLLGTFLKGRRQRVTLATKVGVVPKPGSPPDIVNSPEHIRAACDASLNRLDTDVIDLYYLQRRDDKVPIEDVVGAMADLVRAGKVRHIGLCEVLGETLRRANAVHPIAAVQSEYSLCTRDPEKGILDACRELGVTFVAYCPLSRALLSGAMPSIDALEPGDFRRRLPRFQAEALQKNRQLLPTLQSIADKHGATAAQIALAWLLNKHQHVIPIPGSKQPGHAAENAAAADLRLTTQEIAELDLSFAPAAVVGDRYPPPAMAGIEKA